MNIQHRDGSSWVEPVHVLSLDKCVLLKDHNAVTPVRLEPATHQSRVQQSTTEQLRSLLYILHEREGENEREKEKEKEREVER